MILDLAKTLKASGKSPEEIQKLTNPISRSDRWALRIVS